MRITYRTLSLIIESMSDEQKDSDVTVEIPSDSGSECFSAELRIAGDSHDCGLDSGHPVVFTHVYSSTEHLRRSDVQQIVLDIGLR